MSKSIFSIATASLVSLLAGVALTLVFTAEALESVPDGGSDALANLEAEVKRSGARLRRVENVLERELAATRRDVRAAMDGRVAGGGTGAGGASADGPAAEEPHVARDELERLSAKKLVALAPLADWKTDEDLRAQYLFASEQASLESFGAPDEVAVHGSSEWWTYWNVVADDKIASEYRLKFNNGRLVEGQLVKWEKPRPKPTAQR